MIPHVLSLTFSAMFFVQFAATYTESEKGKSMKRDYSKCFTILIYLTYESLY